MEYNGLVLKYRWLDYSYCFVELVIIKPVLSPFTKLWNKLKFIIWKKKERKKSILPLKNLIICDIIEKCDLFHVISNICLLWGRVKSFCLKEWWNPPWCIDFLTDTNLLANFLNRQRRMWLVISSLIPKYFGMQARCILSAHCDRLKLHHIACHISRQQRYK